MAELRIQPKKNSPSPWLLVGLAVALLAAAAFFFLRPDAALDSLNAPPRPVPAPAASAAADSVGGTTTAAPATGTRAALLALGTDLTALTDRADLRDDTALREQRDNFTSATARLADGDPRASLRPGLVAAASLLLAVQQHGYPALATQAAELSREANALSGRDDTPADQTQNQLYLSHAQALLTALNQPAPSTI